jgi:hypothetical protein
MTAISSRPLTQEFETVCVAGAAEFEPLHFASARNCLDRTSHEWGGSWRRPALLSLSAEALGFDDDHSECNVSNPAAPASQSGLPKSTCKRPRYRGISQIWLSLRIANSVTDAPIEPLVSQATFWCLVFLGALQFGAQCS